jgi:hypothetical protein
VGQQERVIFGAPEVCLSLPHPMALTGQSLSIHTIHSLFLYKPFTYIRNTLNLSPDGDGIMSLLNISNAAHFPRGASSEKHDQL